MAVLFVSLLSSPAAFAKSDNAKESLVAVGDSIPFGYNLGQTNQNPAKTSYPYVIGKLSDLRVRNLGVSGRQSGQLLTALQTNQKYRQAIIHSDYVAVTIGSNDFLGILRAADAESREKQVPFEVILAGMLKVNSPVIFNNITQTIKEVRLLTDSPIVLYNVYNPFQTYDPFLLYGVAETYLPGINTVFENLASTYPDVYLADAYSAFRDNEDEEYVLPGDIHPTEAGQAKLAEIGLDALKLD
ncbi:lipolytic protein G-D-S-L family [Alkalibacterium sp. 20]|nr:lipolytic protein G-D-S-L family [Alkalibacterium sp. 20]